MNHVKRYMNQMMILTKIRKHFILDRNPFGLRWESNNLRPLNCYEGVGGERCAIGILIDNNTKETNKNLDWFIDGVAGNHHSVRMIGKKIFEFVNMRSNKFNFEFLCDMQRIHDDFSLLTSDDPRREQNKSSKDRVYYNPSITNEFGKNYDQELKLYRERIL